jgi:hypothetical protein
MGGERGEVRAYCPLCGASANAPYRLGYSIPIGLERHLCGTRGSRMCAVFAAAHDNAADHARDGAAGVGLKFGSLASGRAKPWDLVEREAGPAAQKTPAVVVKLWPT